jgi:hypothetical protein
MFDVLGATPVRAVVDMPVSPPSSSGTIFLSLLVPVALAVVPLWPAKSTEVIEVAVPVNSIHGKAHKTTASDGIPAPVEVGGTREELLELFGATRQTTWSPIPKRTNLLISDTELCWSGARKGFGYLYFWQASRPPIPVWEFAQCPKSNLTQVVAKDLPTQFVSFSDRTNHSGVGPAVFGTNWLRNSIRVQDGQLIFARLARDRGKVYTMQFVEQSLTNAVVFYIETPSDSVSLPPRRTGP